MIGKAMKNINSNRPSKRKIANRYFVKQTIIGGMGVVYLCVDTAQNNYPVVLKTCKPQYLSDKNVRAQFLREALIWVEIGWHPSIVQAYRAEYDSASNEIYLVLEMVPSLAGEKNPTLRSWLIPGVCIPVEKTLKLMLEVTRGMKYATTRVPGLIHCDLKPENIFISPDGRALVSDFGLVSIPSDIFENLNSALLREKSIRSRAVGTPHYMSPEQWRNRKVSICSDIYSLGCICLELLTGDYTIRGKYFKSIAEGHIRGEAIKKLKGADLPNALVSFLLKCLDKDPQRRFQTWENVEQEIIHLYKVLLNQKIEAENVLFDVSHKTQVLKGETILSIGEAYLDFHEYQIAIKCFEKARAIGKLQNELRLVALSEANIGLAFYMLGHHERGSAHYQKAIAHDKRCGDHEFAITNYKNIGNTYFSVGNVAKAKNNITKIIKHTKQI